MEEEENFSNFGKFKGKVGSKIFRFFFDFRYFFSLREGQEEGNSKIFRFFQNFSFFHKSRVEFGLNMAIFEALVRRRGIRKFFVFSKISRFSIQIPKFTTSDPFVLFPLLVAKVQH